MSKGLELSVEVVNSEAVVSFLRTLSPELVKRIERGVLRYVIYLQRYVVLNKLQGNPLKHRSGNLGRAVVFTQPETSGGVTTAKVGVTTLAPYGKVHEDGGSVSVREHIARSSKGKAYSVRSHIANYPQRAFLRPALDETKGMFLEIIDKAASAWLRG